MTPLPTGDRTPSPKVSGGKNISVLTLRPPLLRLAAADRGVRTRDATEPSESRPVLVEMPICGRFFLLVEMAVAVAPLAPDAGVFWTDDPAAPAPPRGVIGRGPEGMEST